MNKALIAITQGGIQLAQRICKETSGDVYVLDKYCALEDFIPIRTGLKEFMQQIFQNYREVIMIMSCGIAVRSIAPYLQCKTKDPAVVVVDETGSYAISLVSGHLGGANVLAKEIAKITGGIPVITTASDQLGMEAVDELAKRLGLFLEDMDGAKKVTACMVNGKRVGIVSEIDWEYSFNPNLIVTDWDAMHKNEIDALIYIGHKEILPIGIDIPAVKLIPKNLILGVGCRKGIPNEKFIEAVNLMLEKYNIFRKCLKGIATIDVKKEEEAIHNLSRVWSLPIEIIDRKEILKIEDEFKASSFVKNTVGVGAVCEPAAFLASNKGICVVPKESYDGITLSIYREKGVQNER